MEHTSTNYYPPKFTIFRGNLLKALCRVLIFIVSAANIAIALYTFFNFGFMVR